MAKRSLSAPVVAMSAQRAANARETYTSASERLHRRAISIGSMYIPSEDVYYGRELPEFTVTSSRGRGTGTSDTRHPVFESVSNMVDPSVNVSRNWWQQGTHTPVENVNPEFYALAPALGVEDYIAGKAINKGVNVAAKNILPRLSKTITNITDYLPISSRRARYYGQRGNKI